MPFRGLFVGTGTASVQRLDGGVCDARAGADARDTTARRWQQRATPREIKLFQGNPVGSGITWMARSTSPMPKPTLRTSPRAPATACACACISGPAERVQRLHARLLTFSHTFIYIMLTLYKVLIYMLTMCVYIFDFIQSSGQLTAPPPLSGPRSAHRSLDAPRV